MKTVGLLGSAMIGAGLVLGAGVSALAQTTATTTTKSSATVLAPNGKAVTPKVGATTVKAAAKIHKANMTRTPHAMAKAMKPHSAARREAGPITNPNAIVSGVQGSGVAR